MLTEYLSPELMRVPIASRSKEGAIRELVDLLNEQGRTKSADTLYAAVLEREAQRTTGIGRGFAVPHAKSDAVDRLVIAMGVAMDGIDFGAIDGQPVKLIALLASPTNATGTHIEALAKLSRLVTKNETLEKMLASKNAAELYEVIRSHEQEE